MKISSGWAKGLALEAPAGVDTRPTSEKLRAALANSLQQVTQDAAVLELFAGTGAVGLELVSRGAASVVFVEKHPRALKALRMNVAQVQERAKKAGLAELDLTVMASDATVALAQGTTVFDLIWADPPYRDSLTWLQAAAPHLAIKLAAGGHFAFECGSDVAESEACEILGSGWQQRKWTTFGDSALGIWERL